MSYSIFTLENTINNLEMKLTHLDSDYYKSYNQDIVSNLKKTIRRDIEDLKESIKILKSFH